MGSGASGGPVLQDDIIIGNNSSEVITNGLLHNHNVPDLYGTGAKDLYNTIKAVTVAGS
jgi:hypothetical protein